MSKPKSSKVGTNYPVSLDPMPFIQLDLRDELLDLLRRIVPEGGLKFASEDLLKTHIDLSVTNITTYINADQNRVKQIIIDSDRTYTNEHDRQVANDYKVSILAQLNNPNWSALAQLNGKDGDE